MNSISSVPIIDRVPHEILQDIFLLACFGRYYISANGLPFQHTLLAVSRRWKFTAVSFPKLWSNISIQVGYARNVKANSAPSRLAAPFTAAIQYVGTAPMSCVIHFADEPSPVILELLSILVPTSRQWVSFYAYGGERAPHIFLSLYRNLPLLESLIFNVGKNTDVVLSHIFSEAPKLVDVHMTLGENDVGYVLPWTQLQRVELRSHYSSLPYLQKLTQSPQLEFFQCSNLWTVAEPQDSQNDVVILSSVKEVDMDSPYIYRFLALPSLETATIQASHLDPFKSMVSKSGCRIQTLNMKTLTGFPSMMDLEGFLPALTRLKMFGYEVMGIRSSRRDLKMMFTELDFLRAKFFNLEELWLSMSCVEVWKRDGLVRILDFLWELVSSRKHLRRATLHIMYGIYGVPADEHMPLLDIGSLDEVVSFRKLKQMHAVNKPLIDLTVLYSEYGQQIHLMDANPQIIAYPHSYDVFG